jgi:hypothetical protein
MVELNGVAWSPWGRAPCNQSIASKWPKFKACFDVFRASFAPFFEFGAPG